MPHRVKLKCLHSVRLPHSVKLNCLHCVKLLCSVIASQCKKVKAFLASKTGWKDFVSAGWILVHSILWLLTVTSHWSQRPFYYTSHLVSGNEIKHFRKMTQVLLFVSLNIIYIYMHWHDWLHCWPYLAMYIFMYTTQCLQTWALKLNHKIYCSIFCDLISYYNKVMKYTTVYIMLEIYCSIFCDLDINKNIPLSSQIWRRHGAFICEYISFSDFF